MNENTLMTYVLTALSLSLLLSPPLMADSKAVYLKPNGSIPTGHFDTQSLKQQAVKYDQFQWLWVRDSRGQKGWILKSTALLPLDFSRQALLTKGKAIHSKPYHYEINPKKLPRSQIVTLVSRYRNWYKIIYKEKNKKPYAWVQAQHLRPYSKDGGYFFSKVKTWLRKEPRIKAKVITPIGPGLPIIPLHAKGDWALVSFAGHRGYIPFRNLRTRLNMALKVKTDKGYFKPHPALYKQKIVEIFENPLWVGTGAYSLELKSRPETGSDTVATLHPWQSMTIKGYSIRRWGQSRIPGWGKLWWPESTIDSSVEIIESFGPKLTLLKKSDIYQIEKSPVIQGLFFASTTHGIYRSFDRQSWYPLKDFKTGLPIKMAGNGTLFIGDKVSFDQGESFHHFIRWDRIFDNFPAKARQAKGPIEILNVEPHFNDHRKVTLSLRVGNNRYLQFQTPDLGQNWVSL